MRALAQLFYFLSTIPGLSFLNRIGSNLSRVNVYAERAKAAKHSMNDLKNKKGKDDESGDQQS